MRNTNNEPGQLSDWDTVEEDTEEPRPILGDDNLSQAIHLGEIVLELSTGHDAYQRRKIVLYAIATYYVGQLEQFPGLLILGNPSTGKSATLNFLKGTCLNVAELTAETTSEAAFKARMNRSNYGTLIIEEADKMSKRDLDGLLNTRPIKSSALWIKSVRIQGHWEEREFQTYGATVVHKRIPFEEAALMRRMIVVNTVRRQGDYIKIGKSHKLIKKFHEKLMSLPSLPSVGNKWGIEPGVFDCYLPIIALATVIHDEWFISKLVAEMKESSEDLRIDEGHLEPQTLLRALIALTYEKYGENIATRRINFDVTLIGPTVVKIAGSDSPAALLKANQRNRILRKNFGFSIENFGGAYRVCFTQAKLITVCDRNGVKDEVLEIWRAKLNEAQGLG